ncbi:MAG: dinitrogenase iron-molybdenum cofactor biosynthesis protein [Anaerolineales bacterium]|nr:dinitrogenase iron-molybdenum cofactor biosynthesis protein [Anaerolineales bacterium]
MKIAATTNDGKTISHHFGRAPYYLVATVEDGQITHREMREKAHHAHGNGHHHEHQHDERIQIEENSAAHRATPETHNHHQMAEIILDCEAVLTRGMGRGAYQNMQAYQIRPIITDIASIDDAVLAYALGKIVDHPEKLH